MPMLIALAARFGIPEPMRRLAVIASLAIALFMILGVAKCSYDRSIIASHDAAQSAATAKADRKADDAAANTRRADDSRLAQERAQLEKVKTNAKSRDDAKDPNGVAARLRCIRLQQAARASNSQPPACG